MFYHASPVKGIKTLLPFPSDGGKQVLYFSQKRENVLVYLSNAVEKYCRETNFHHRGQWAKWGPYGFERDGRLRLEEYWPHALEETYRGVSGCIYRAETLPPPVSASSVPFAVFCEKPVPVSGCEEIPDAYEEILSAERDGLISILRYSDLSSRRKEWLQTTVRAEHEKSAERPEYKHFLEGKFSRLL